MYSLRTIHLGKVGRLRGSAFARAIIRPQWTLTSDHQPPSITGVAGANRGKRKADGTSSTGILGGVRTSVQVSYISDAFGSNNPFALVSSPLIISGVYMFPVDDPTPEPYFGCLLPC